ncbi:hypothetical protein [Clostridium sp.]
MTGISLDEEVKIYVIDGIVINSKKVVHFEQPFLMDMPSTIL